jgi:hypothetical protein
MRERTMLSGRFAEQPDPNRDPLPSRQLDWKIGFVFELMVFDLKLGLFGIKKGGLTHMKVSAAAQPLVRKVEAECVES